MFTCMFHQVLVAEFGLIFKTQLLKVKAFCQLLSCNTWLSSAGVSSQVFNMGFVQS